MHIFLVIPIIFVSFLENLAPCLCETIHKVNIRLICFFRQELSSCSDGLRIGRAVKKCDKDACMREN